MDLILEFTDPRAVHVEESGGKGANLARLTQAKFPVPTGFIVTAQAHRLFLASAPELVRALDQLPYDNPAALETASRKLREALRRHPLPPLLIDALGARLRTENGGWSVRSSSTFEDMAGAAFAGQHDTYLNVRGTMEIIDRVRDCFVSLWEDRALAYRARRGINQHQAAMAVVVQQMVFCDTAGVAFSVNPVNGRMDEIVIDANFGLGESVVGGETPIDHFILERPSGTVKEARIALKTRRVVASQTETVEEDIPLDLRERPCLSPPQLTALATLSLQIEEHFRFPQDIEWGWSGTHLHLLQARPVTSIAPRWTRDESAERFPNPVTPLTWDFVDAGFHQSLAYSFERMGFPPYGGKWFTRQGAFIYGNQNAVDLYARRSPIHVKSLEELRRLAPHLRGTFAWVIELPTAWSRDLDHYLIRIGQLSAETLETKTTADVWKHVIEINDLGARYFRPNIAISIGQGLLHRFLNNILTVAVGPEAVRLMDDLLAFCDTKTGQVNRELEEMATLAGRDPQLTASLSQTPGGVWWSGPESKKFPAFVDRFQKFLRDHGHREVDFDAYVPPWMETPGVPLDHVRLLLAHPPAVRSIDKEPLLRRRQRSAETELLSKIPEDLHFLYGEVVRLARVYTALDDLEHYQTTRLTIPMRRALSEMGRRLVKLSSLPEPSDIYFARRTEVETALNTDAESDWRRISDTVKKEKALWEASRSKAPDWEWGQATDNIPRGEGLIGLPGSSGEAEGPVFHVRGTEDFSKFPVGAVLVARTTNPAWTPLFHLATAVITESGGPLSHGAVTAREMKIPAVTSVRGCLERLQNGQRVYVDGSRGRVTLIKDAPPPVARN